MCPADRIGPVGGRVSSVSSRGCRGSRYAVDRDTALRRMEMSGATLTTTEAALFEWCEVAGTPEFKRVSAIVRETPPLSDLPPGDGG